MEADVFEIYLSHLQHIAAVGQEHVTSLHVGSHELVLAFLECLKLRLIIAFYPAGLVEAGRLPTAQSVVLMLQTVLYDLKLQLTYRAYEFAAVELADEHLGHSLTHKLVNALGQLLGTHGISVLYILEHLGREAGKTLEVEFLTLSESIAYLEIACIGKSYDIARPSLFNGALALRHELCGRREAEGLVKTDMIIGLVTLELTGTDLAERYR